MTAIAPATAPSTAWTRRPLLRYAAGIAAMPFLPTVARAATVSGVAVPDSMVVDGKTLVLNGAALRTLTFLHVRIYVVALYLPQRSADSQAILASPGPKVIALHYIHSGSKDQVQDRYREGEKVNCGGGGCDPALQADFDKLMASAAPVQEGDVTEFIVTANAFRVLFNGRQVATFNDNRLGNMVIEGFIGSHPPSPELRAALLGVPM
jgi:hypothetical protein